MRLTYNICRQNQVSSYYRYYQNTIFKSSANNLSKRTKIFNNLYKRRQIHQSIHNSSNSVRNLNKYTSIYSTYNNFTPRMRWTRNHIIHSSNLLPKQKIFSSGYNHSYNKPNWGRYTTPINCMNIRSRTLKHFTHNKQP